MDGFEANEGVILIAATNRPDVLDPALLRPGRFDRQIVVPNPDINGREQILKVHMRKVPLAPDVEARTIARGTPGFSGADLANLVNEAALMAARAGKRVVTMHDFEQAKDKVMMGAERRSMVMTEKDKEETAYHEAGHALVGLHVPGNDPLHKVTIIPRGRALGVTMNLPETDRYSLKFREITAKLAMMFGGRLAEEIIYGVENVSTGASNDIQQATNLARRMVTEWGMSEKLGRLRYVDNQEEVFLGHSVTRSQTISGATAKLIDEEVRRIIEEAEALARKVLTEHIDQLHAIAKALLEYETLSGDEVNDLLKGTPIRQGGDHSGPAKPRSAIPTTGASHPRPQPGGFEPKPAGS
jgi:cell division protease FtsH